MKQSPDALTYKICKLKHLVTASLISTDVQSYQCIKLVI